MSQTRPWGWLALLPLLLAAFAPGQDRGSGPLSEAELKKQIGTRDAAEVVALLERRGIDFSVNLDLLQSLKDAGAHPAVLEAVHKAGRARRQGNAIDYPGVRNLLRARGESAVLKKLEESPTQFTLDANQAKELTEAGASPELLEALQGRRVALGSDVTDYALILDCSGSMNDKTRDGKTKIEAARQTAVQLIKDIPNGKHLTFIVYGHKRGRTAEEGCQAVEVVCDRLELSDDRKDRLAAEIGKLKAVGHTPIALSLHKAGEALAKAEGLSEVVLITDGMETCHGNPAAEAAQLARTLQLMDGVNVIGFDIDPKERDAVKKIAQEGKGKYYDAKTAKELGDAAKQRAEKRERQERFAAVQQKAVKQAEADKSVSAWLAKLPKDGRAVSGGTELARLPGGSRPNTGALSPNGKRLALSVNGDKVLLFDVEAGKQATALEGLPPQVSALAPSPDGKTLAVGGDKSIVLYDAATGKEQAALKGEHTGKVVSLAWSADGTLLAGADENRVLVWDTSRREVRFRPKPDDTIWEKNWSARFAPRGAHLVIWNSVGLAPIDSSAYLLDLGRGPGEDLVKARIKVGDPKAFRFSRDGSLLVSGHGNGKVALWDCDTGKNLATLDGHSGNVTNLSFSADQATLASYGNDHKVILWDVPARKQRTSLTAGGGKSFAGGFFFAGGEFLLTVVEKEPRPQVRDAAGKELGTLDLDWTEWLLAGWDQDGKVLSVVTKDGSVRVYHADRMAAKFKGGR